MGELDARAKIFLCRKWTNRLKKDVDDDNDDDDDDYKDESEDVDMDVDSDMMGRCLKKHCNEKECQRKHS